MLCRNLVAIFISFFCFGATAEAREMVYPSPNISPAQVVAIQLSGLQYNDVPSDDSGIRQAWEFAHPRNRSVTGPVSRFIKMVKGPNFGLMLNHSSHKILQAESREGWQQFDVFVEAANGDVLKFLWIVEKVTDGQFENCWMTTSVSAPLLAGQGS